MAQPPNVVPPPPLPNPHVPPRRETIQILEAMLKNPQPILAVIAAERAAGTADHLIRVVVSFNQQGAMTVNRYRRGTPAHGTVIVANTAPHDQLPTSPLLVVDSPIVGAAPWDVLGVERRNLVQPFGLEPT